MNELTNRVALIRLARRRTYAGELLQLLERRRRPITHAEREQLEVAIVGVRDRLIAWENPRTVRNLIALAALH